MISEINECIIGGSLVNFGMIILFILLFSSSNLFVLLIGPLLLFSGGGLIIHSLNRKPVFYFKGDYKQ